MKKRLIGLEHKDYKFDNEVKIEWYVSKYCNNNCSYCGNSSHINTPQNNISLHDFKLAFDNLTSVIDKESLRIDLTGGEPTLIPYLIDVLQYAKDLEINKLSLSTNGSRDFDYYKKCIDLIESITISYHMEYQHRYDIGMILDLQKYINSLDEKKYLKVNIMFLPGTMNKVKLLVDIFEKNNIRYIIRRIRPAFIKDHKSNKYDENGLLIKGIVAQPFDNESVTINANMPVVKYYSDDELQYINDNEVSNFNNVLAYYSDGSMEQTNVNEITSSKLNRFEGWKCWAGIQSIIICDDGNVLYGHCSKNGTMGNVFETFKLLKEPRICNIPVCTSASYINTSKYCEGSPLRICK